MENKSFSLRGKFVVLVGIFCILLGIIDLLLFSINVNPFFQIPHNVGKDSFTSYTIFIGEVFNNEYVSLEERKILDHSAQNLFEELAQFIRKWEIVFFIIVSTLFFIGLLWIMSGVLVLARRLKIWPFILIFFITFVHYFSFFFYTVNFPTELERINVKYYQVFYDIYNVRFDKNLCAFDFGFAENVHWVVMWNMVLNIFLTVMVAILVTSLRNEFQKS